jgi:hypothetical protein
MRKNPAAVALGRKGGLKGGKARAAGLTPEQRSSSARAAVTARWAKAGKASAAVIPYAEPKPDTSDATLRRLLARLRETDNADEIKVLAGQIERVVFHKQFSDA